MNVFVPNKKRKTPKLAADGMYAPIAGDIVTVRIAMIRDILRPNRSERYPNKRDPQNTPKNIIAP